MADPSSDTGNGVIVRPPSEVDAVPFTDDEYHVAAEMLNIRKPQLDRCRHLATLGRSTNFISRHDQNLGTLVWEREQIMEDIARVNQLLDSDLKETDPDNRMPGVIMVRLMKLRADLYKIIADSIVPGLEHLGDRRMQEEKVAKRRPTFAPGTQVLAMNSEVHLHPDKVNGGKRKNSVIIEE